MARNVTLTEGEREEIKALRRDNPRMPYREIGALFGVTPSAVCTVLAGKHEFAQRHMGHEPKPAMLAPDPRKEPHAKPSAAFVSFIRAIPKDRLTAGNGRVARPIPA